MTNLPSPIFGLLLLQRSCTILDMRQGVLNFPIFSMQLKHADNTYFNTNEPFLNPTKNLVQPGKQTVIRIKSQVYTENEVTGIIPPSADLESNNDLIICPALIATQNRHYAVLINKFLVHPYTLKKRMPHCHFLNVISTASKIHQTNQSSTTTPLFRHKSQ